MRFLLVLLACAPVAASDMSQSQASADITTEQTSRIAADVLIGASTAALNVRLTASEVSQSTNMPRVAAHDVWMGTASVHLSDLAASTTTLKAALDTKLSSGAVPSSFVDLSTVTTALAGKLSNTAAISPSLIDLSTVTTALAGKQAADADLDDLADGSLTASKVGSGYAASGLTGAVPTAAVDLATITTALDGKLSTTGGTLNGALTVLGTSVTASAFFGDGSHLTGTLSTNATGFQITSLTPETFSNTAFGPCMVGSTATLTCVGGACSVFLTWSGEWHSATLAANPYISFEVDGALVAGASGLNSMQEPVANYYTSVSAQYLKLNLAEGTHNFCVAFYVGANSIIVGTGGNSFSGFVVH